MRCVSYTRTTCNKSMLVAQEPESITHQNEMINEFVHRRGWKIEKKYSDRKKDQTEETAFLEMKEDGIAGKFDCLVVASLYYCGKGTTLALDLLSFVFLPAGIQFAVVDDDICSAEMTEQEAAEYLKAKRKQFRAEKSSVVGKSACERRKYPKYGYRYKGDALVIDQEAADTIREIFRLANEGYTDTEIAKALNEKKIEPSHIYMKRIRGKPAPTSGNEKWLVREVDAILLNQLYMGKWERTIKDEKVIVECPAIVSEELFRNVRKLHEARWHGGNARGKNRTPLSGKMSDYDTGYPIVMLSRQSTNEKAFYMLHPQSLDVHYKKRWMLYSDVERLVMDQVIQEKQRAQTAVRILQSDEGKEHKKRQLQILSEQAQEILRKMMRLEERRHQIGLHQVSGVQDGDCEAELTRIDEMFSQMDLQLTDIQGKVEEANQTFCEDNPWIRTFCGLDTDLGLTMELSKKCIQRVECVRFEDVVVQFKFSEWFEKLPSEWFGGIA